MRFEWDENKARLNPKNHNGVTFDDALKVFTDIWAIDDFDSVHTDSAEQRFLIIGIADEKLLHVAFTFVQDEHGHEIVRIISARKAVGKERKGYEEARNRYDK